TATSRFMRGIGILPDRVGRPRAPPPVWPARRDDLYTVGGPTHKLNRGVLALTAGRRAAMGRRHDPSDRPDCAPPEATGAAPAAARCRPRAVGRSRAVGPDGPPRPRAAGLLRGHARRLRVPQSQPAASDGPGRK